MYTPVVYVVLTNYDRSDGVPFYIPRNIHAPSRGVGLVMSRGHIHGRGVVVAMDRAVRSVSFIVIFSACLMVIFRARWLSM